MASRVEMIGCLIVVTTLLMGGATADTHTVGDGLGWNIPPGGSIAYSTWASTQDFEVGDIISFSWTGTHNVAEVTKPEYDNCTATNPIGTIQTTSPATFTLDNITNPRYFICTVNGHCNIGQKVTIRLGRGRGSSAASSLSTGAFSALLLALAISFLSHT